MAARDSRPYLSGLIYGGGVITFAAAEGAPGEIVVKRETEVQSGVEPEIEAGVLRKRTPSPPPPAAAPAPRNAYSSRKKALSLPEAAGGSAA